MAEVETKTLQVTYIPKDGDPHTTAMAGVIIDGVPKKITFRAHSPVSIPSTAFITAPLRLVKEMEDGSIRTQAIERPVKLIDSLINNPWFLVEGHEQADRKRGRPRLPSNADEYRGHALRWIAGAEAGPDMKARWASEEKLRDECGCTDADLAQVMPFYWARLEVLGEAA